MSDAASSKRIQTARTHLSQLQEEMAFERINVKCSLRKRHWRFYYNKTELLLQYWPARSVARLIGEADERECCSAAQAGQLAIQQRDRLLAGELQQ
jgi:hypothetical protein